MADYLKNSKNQRDEKEIELDKYCNDSGELFSECPTPCFDFDSGNVTFGYNSNAATVNSLCSEQTGNPKKILNDELIKSDLRNKRRKLKDYSDEAIIMVCSTVVWALGSVVGPIFFLLGLLRLFVIIVEEVSKTIGTYYVLERPCIECLTCSLKNGKTEYRMYFPNKNNKKTVCVKADESFCNMHFMGDTFYVVFLKGRKQPYLCYNTREWTM